MFVVLQHDNRDAEVGVTLFATKRGCESYLQDAYDGDLSEEDFAVLFNDQPVWLGDVFLRVREVQPCE